MQRRLPSPSMRSMPRRRRKIFPLLSLPPELFELMAEYLDLEKGRLDNLRLVCRQANDMCLTVFHRRFHSLAILPAWEDSLNMAWQIVKRKNLARNIRSLTILVNEFPDPGEEPKLGRWRAELDFESARQKKRDMDRLRAKDRDTRMLDAIFKALRNHGGIEKIEFVGKDCEYPLDDRDQQPIFCGSRTLFDDFVSYDEDSKNDRSLRVSAQALVKSGIRTERISISSTGWWIISAEVMGSPHSTRLFAEMFTPLKHLDIKLESFPQFSESATYAKKLAKAVAHATNLQTLKVKIVDSLETFDLPDDEIDDYTFTNALCLRTLEKLESFYVDCGSVDWLSFSAFMNNHEERKLRSATLDSVMCQNVPESGTWFCLGKAWNFDRNEETGVVEMTTSDFERDE